MVCCVGENEHRERKQCQIYYTPKAFYFPMPLCFSNSCKTSPHLFGLFFVLFFFFPRCANSHFSSLSFPLQTTTLFSSQSTIREAMSCTADCVFKCVCLYLLNAFWMSSVHPPLRGSSSGMKHWVKRLFHDQSQTHTHTPYFYEVLSNQRKMDTFHFV